MPGHRLPAGDQGGAGSSAGTARLRRPITGRYWHGAGGYSGVALLVRHSFFTERPAFTHPSFDMEHRIVVADLGAIQVASVYVPNGGKDYEAKIRFSTAFAAWATETIGDRPDAIDLWRPERRPRGARRASEGAETESDRHAPRGARAVRPVARRGPGRRRPRARSGQQRAVHLVGALAESPAAKHRLAHRLRAGEPGAGRTGDFVRFAARITGRAITPRWSSCLRRVEDRSSKLS